MQKHVVFYSKLKLIETFNFTAYTNNMLISFFFSFFLCIFFFFSAGQFVRTLDNYDIIIPMRVTESGDVITHNLHPHATRHRRNSDQLSDVLHYKVNVDNSDYVLKLQPNRKLYNPSLLIEKKKNSFHNVSDSTFLRYSQGDQMPCHYTGEILSKRNSKVALALCKGLVSVFTLFNMLINS